MLTLQLRIAPSRHAASWLGLGLAMLVSLPAGCLPSQRNAQPSALGMRLRPKPIVPGVNGLLMDVIYLERPMGDPVINRDLWESADDERLELALRRNLEQRGFRVAVLGGLPPAKLHTLFDEEEIGQMNGEHMLLESGSPTQLQTSSVYPVWPDETAETDHTKSAEYRDAVGSLRVIPSITSDGLVELSITPEIEHGEATRRWVPSQEPQGALDWSIQVGRRIRAFDELRFSLRLRSGQFAMLSCVPAQPQSLGTRFFSRLKDERWVQRVLLIQAKPSRAAAAARASLP